ncbi:hypothetical protein Tdes44962_MAKER07973 [Teratosphaeria destructans]|uniref:Uncharacterized protein n=1 Tax=Teratosphaeria destructans TaxID=418781 RepID=A0A9W7W586_9PEZI|nr:hypothetical protein Tdes44962_MAKER07973 [Teratosphaeria destructans]
MHVARYHDPNGQAASPAPRSDQVRQGRRTTDRAEQIDITPARTQLHVDRQPWSGLQAGATLTSSDVAIKGSQDKLWEEDFLKTAVKNNSIPLPAANASVDQVFNYIKTARPPLWHRLPDRVPVARTPNSNNGFTYHFAENAAKALQRRGYDGAFLMGKQAEFGFHIRAASVDCVACRRLFIASGRTMPDEVLKRIHDRQLGDSRLLVELEGAP